MAATMSESLRDFHLFVAVYEERSFTAAAAREHAKLATVGKDYLVRDGDVMVFLHG